MAGGRFRCSACGARLEFDLDELEDLLDTLDDDEVHQLLDRINVRVRWDAEES